MKEKRIAPIIISFILMLAFVFVLYYLTLPVMSLNFFGTLIFILFISIPLAVVLYLSNIKYGMILPILIVIFILFKLISSSALVNHKEYRMLIGEIERKEFSTEIEPIDISKLPIVDKKLAENIGDKKLGEQVALGSQVSLSNFTLININNELYWVSPLVHSGFFKWNANKEGTTGYIKINATNPRDTKLVQELNGEKIRIKYQPNAYFSGDLKRHIYNSGYKQVGLTDYSFELDNNGRPFWVVTKYKKTIGTGGNKTEGIIVVDAQTGNIKEYAIDNIPAWVDRVIPVDFALKQLNDWGKYVNGWWNPSKKGIVRTTSGFNYIYNNGNCYIYTGLTSAGSDESTVGFALINTRTKETTFYKISGSHENAAMESAEGKVQNLGYTSTFPILINIENEPTYFMTLKDKKGLVKLYAMVNVNDYSIVGTGESLAKTKSNYVKYLKSHGKWEGIGKAGDEKSIKGTIIRIGYSIIDDTTYYYIVLEEIPGKIFISPLNMSNELPLTNKGDKVSITYYNNTNPNIDVLSFDNLEFTQTLQED